MGWFVHGTDFHFDIRIDKFGLSVSGRGNQVYKSSLDILIDTSETEALPANWSVYRASEAAELANLVSLDVLDMKRHLSAEDLQSTTTPIGVIRHHHRIDSNNPRHIGFCAFLPDPYFDNFWKMLQPFLGSVTMRHWFNFGFVGFIPHRVSSNPEVISYDDWLAGRPCITDDLALGIEPQSD
jgi:hypothetical protein